MITHSLGGGAISCRGYGYHKFLDDFIEENQVKKILEIGVANGENAKNMIEKTLEDYSPEEVEYYGFDTFEGGGDNKPEEVREKLSSTGCSVNLVKGDTRDTFCEMIEEVPRMDLIFIDGGHDYEVVQNDWQFSKSLMKEDTGVFFHNYNYNYSGVKKTVDNISRQEYSVEVLSPESDYKTAYVKRKG